MGSNFKAGASVIFGDVACDSVTVISADEIACTAPPHLPAVVDVAITNPDGESSILLRGFTYQGIATAPNPRSVYLPLVTIRQEQQP